jgi:hypothetical protein
LGEGVFRKGGSWALPASEARLRRKLLFRGYSLKFYYFFLGPETKIATSGYFLSPELLVIYGIIYAYLALSHFGLSSLKLKAPLSIGFGAKPFKNKKKTLAI